VSPTVLSPWKLWGPGFGAEICRIFYGKSPETRSKSEETQGFSLWITDKKIGNLDYIQFSKWNLRRKKTGMLPTKEKINQVHGTTNRKKEIYATSS